MKLDDWVARHSIPAASDDSQPEMIWVDVETTGLDKQDRGRPDHIVEVGFIVTDRFGCPLPDDAALFQSLVIDRKSWGRVVDVMNEGNTNPDDTFVRNLHHTNGLWAELRAAWESFPTAMEDRLSPERVTEQVISWLEGYWGIGVGSGDLINSKLMPLSGSSLRFDRDMLAHRMQELDDFFSYRVIDVSGIREVCRMQRPDLFGRLSVEMGEFKSHRVLDDIGDSIKLYRWFLEKFLRIA